MRWENYPYKDIACELKKGLKFGFPLNYSGPRSPITSGGFRSTRSICEWTCNYSQKYNALCYSPSKYGCPFWTCPSWNPCARFCPTPLRKGCLGQIHINHDDCGTLAFRRRNCSSYETHPKFDTLEAANLITCIYLRYTCALPTFWKDNQRLVAPPRVILV
jgi:hypothetical protein